MIKTMLLIGVFLSLFNNLNAKDFEDGYYKCILIEDEGKQIQKRRAEALRESDLSLIIKKTELIFDNSSNEYVRTGISEGVKVDVYGYEHDSGNFYNIFFNEKKLQLFELKESIHHFTKKKYSNMTIYSCKEASFFEKALMIKDLL